MALVKCFPGFQRGSCPEESKYPKVEALGPKIIPIVAEALRPSSPEY